MSSRSTPHSGTKRTCVIVDGQNLYHAARTAFGHHVPQYDIRALALQLCKNQGWDLNEVRFYTGIPSRKDNAHWHDFWTAKLLRMSRQGVEIFTRELRYRHISVRVGNEARRISTALEKGIDVRMAIDIMRLTQQRRFDVVMILSQDQDLSEVASEVKNMAKEQGRWIQVASAFPVGGNANNPRGINGTEWFPITYQDYQRCLDPMRYVMPAKAPAATAVRSTVEPDMVEEAYPSPD